MAPAMLNGVPAVFDGERQKLFSRLWKQLSGQLERNTLLDDYYTSARRFKDLGISLPPTLSTSIPAALGWPAKSVNYLARKHRFDGFSLNGELDPFKVAQILTETDFEAELKKAITSCYKHGCSFLVTFPMEDGRIRVRTYSARNATLITDPRSGETVGALVVTDVDERFAPKGFTVFFADGWVSVKAGKYKWVMKDKGASYAPIPVQALIYDPTVERPFGRSRITREVRYLTDAALRTLVRAEVAAEFFAAPQRYALGVAENAFKDMDSWSAIAGRIWAMEVNEEGQAPTVGQFPQMTMEPHLAQYRQLAQNFCAETNLPMSAVGLFADNPASAEAMQAAEAALSEEADYQSRVFTPAIRRVLGDVVRLAHTAGKPEGAHDLSELWNVQVRWTPARYVSPQASSDYIMKIVQAFPEVAGTTVAYRRAGFSQPEIEELQAEIGKDKARSLIETLRQRVGSDGNSEQAQDAAEE